MLLTFVHIHMQIGGEHHSISVDGSREETKATPKNTGCKTASRAGTTPPKASERARHQTGGLRGTRRGLRGTQQAARGRSSAPEDAIGTTCNAVETTQSTKKVCRDFRELNVIHIN